MVYDAKYFFKKFSKIPPKKWGTGKLQDDKGRRCVLGHCGVKENGDKVSYDYSPQGLLLNALLKQYTGFGAIDVNDGYINNAGDPMRHENFTITINGKTPRARVLDALRKIIALENK
jgi:hypothetical protein